MNISIPLGHILTSGIGQLYSVKSVFNNLRNCQTVSSATALFYIPTAVCEGYNFSTSSLTLLLSF